MNNNYTLCSICNRRISISNIKRHEEACLQKQIKLQKILICEKCGKEYQRKNGTDRFCSRSCAASVSLLDKKGLLKKALCYKCNKIYEVSIHANKIFICKNCRSKEKEERNKLSQISVPCSFCGRLISKRNINVHKRACKSNPSSIKKSYNYHRQDKKSGYIYKTTNNINGKIYIGKKINKIEESINYLGSGIFILRAIKKYGKENFVKEVLDIVENGDLNERERFWIKKYNSNIYDIGYNLTSGGDGGSLFKDKHHTEKTKKRISNTLKTNNIAGEYNGSTLGS